MFTDSELLQRPGLIVEIVGPAGAGKTTVLSALNQQDEEIRPIYALRHFRYFPFYAYQAVLLLPFLVYQGCEGRWYQWREINRMIRLKAMRQILRSCSAKRGSITVLDQGPVYTLTILAGFGSQSSRDAHFMHWWEKILSEWAAELDVVVWLDAPNDVLLQRIHTRDKQHIVKDRPDPEAIDFLGHCRSIYQQVIDKLAVAGGPKVLCYDTSRHPLAHIVENTLSVLTAASAGRR